MNMAEQREQRRGAACKVQAVCRGRFPHMSIRMSIHTYIHVSTPMSEQMSTHMSTHVSTHMSIHMLFQTRPVRNRLRAAED